MVLRPYQEAAKEAVYAFLRTRSDNPCVVIPTGGGKTPIIASICRDAVTSWNFRVLILSHRRELLQQSADKLRAVCPEVQYGIYSAGLNSRDTQNQVIVAGIQSVYERACELGRFDLIIVDETHLIPAEGDGLYRRFLADARVINPNVRVVGFTATPFRLKTGPICTPGGILNAVCYEIGVRDLIAEGFLTPLVTRESDTVFDTSSIQVQAGEFVADDMARVMDDDWVLPAACEELVRLTHDRNSVLIFASGVDHGRHIVDLLNNTHGVDCGFVTGQTPTAERDTTIGRFSAGELKYLVNVGVLTIGFDAPCVDAVVLLRPTMSPGLYYQMVGRGFRTYPGKRDCLVLDFGGNVKRHGPVDTIRVEATEPEREVRKTPSKSCPQCKAVIAAGFAVCPHCGFVFDQPEPQQHDARASSDPVLSCSVVDNTYQVGNVRYEAHTKSGAGPGWPRSLRVSYWTPEINDYVREWICFEHQGYARQKAVEWWSNRSDAPVPNGVEQALAYIQDRGIAPTLSITVRQLEGMRFPEILSHELGPRPTPPQGHDPLSPGQISDAGQSDDFVNDDHE